MLRSGYKELALPNGGSLFCGLLVNVALRPRRLP